MLRDSVAPLASARGTAFTGPSLVEMLGYRAAVQPHERAYTFLRDGEDEETTCTWSELDRRCRAIAAYLQVRLEPGDRAILLYPAGLDFVAAFFGCLYAGVIAVPAQPPSGGHAEAGAERLRAIMADAEPRAVLSSSALPQRARTGWASDGAIGVSHRDAEWVLTDRLEASLAEAWRGPEAHPNTIAFLQYTSGSTARPKGVVVSHGNLLHNLAAAFRLGDTDADGASVSWLPMTHDMGLIEGVLQPAFSGCPAYLMSPGAFLQRPSRWLRAIARYRATRSGGPNFAYDLAVDRVGSAERLGLDLHAWRAAYNGAEPVREETLARFTAAYRAYGFRGDSFRPCYGLAESTLLVTTRRWEPGATSGGVVSCGAPADGLRVAIVDPSSDRACPDEAIGEIRVAGPSVALGYWNQPDESARAFVFVYADDNASDPCPAPQCQAPDSLGDAASRWLRTGDLGFVRHGELFVTGRIKDLLIVRGVKHFPQDLERTIERAHPAVRPGAVVAVAVSTSPRGDRIAIVAELRARLGTRLERALIASMRQIVAGEHGIQLHGVALVAPGTVPKTPSGKLRRFLCRDQWRAGTLVGWASWCEEEKGLTT